MIHIKNGGVSGYKKLRDLNAKVGETFLSEDGTVLVIIKPSCFVSFLRTDGGIGAEKPFPTDSTISGVDAHHNFKRVEVDLVIRAIGE